MAAKSVIDVLVKDHDAMRDMLHRLQETDGRQAGRLLDELIMELRLHTAVEEEVVYPAFWRYAADHGAQKTVEAHLDGHEQVDRVLADLRRLEPASAPFRSQARVLADMVGQHAQKEEDVMLPRLQQECAVATLQEMRARVEDRKNQLSRELSPSAVEASKQQLDRQAERLDIEGRSGMAKDELRAALARR